MKKNYYAEEHKTWYIVIMETLFVKRLTLKRDKVEDWDQYPFCIPVIRNLDQLNFRKPVSFLVGENGSGKSTILESLAVNLGLNAEGGTENFSFETRNTTSVLSEYLSVGKLGRPRNKFFLRAESFYNFSSEMENIGREDARIFDSYGGNLHERSHGESFIQLVKNRFGENGLYLLDEPEAALSPSRQMTLMCLIDQLVKQNCQFIIATHSPILLSYREGEIFDLDDGLKVKDYRDTEIYRLYRMYLDNPEYLQHKLFD